MLFRSARLPFLHAQLRRAQLCDLPYARAAADRPRQGESRMTSSARDALHAAAKERILLTDGGWGTQIQIRKLAEADYAGALGLSLIGLTTSADAHIADRYTLLTIAGEIGSEHV